MQVETNTHLLSVEAGKNMIHTPYTGMYFALV